MDQETSPAPDLDQAPLDQAPLDQAPPDLTLAEVAAVSRVPLGSLRHARELGLLPEPDPSTGRWSAAAVREIQRRWPQMAAALADAQELGAVRCSQLLSRMTGLTVSPANVETLAARGLLRPSRIYQRRALFRVTDLQALAGDPFTRALLSEIIDGQ
jgi:hypothetical protein